MEKYKQFKRKIYEVIGNDSKQNWLGTGFDYFIVALILLNVAAIVIESFQNLNSTISTLLSNFEVFSVIVFTIEYVLRIWTANLKFEHKNLINPKVRFIASPMGIVDLLAILPFYLPMLIPIDLRFIRILRLARLLRVIKLTRYSNALILIGKILKDKKDELIAAVFLTFILLLVASSLMYYIEHTAQPDAFPNILASFWWAIATLTTIGYGDVYPITGWGRVLSSIVALLGIGLVALPTGIISSSFIEEISKKSQTTQATDTFTYCPHCGQKLNE